MRIYPRHTQRLVVRPPWGYASPPPFTRNITSDVMWDKGIDRPSAIVNLWRNRDRNLTKDNQRDFEATSAMRLDYTIVWAGSGNVVSDWNSPDDTLDFCDTPPNPFFNQVSGVFYGRTDNTATVTAKTAFIPANTSFSLNLFLDKPSAITSPSGYTYVSLFDLGFGGSKFDLGYDFRILNGSAFFMRKSMAWNEADDEALQILMAKNTRDDADQTQIDTYIHDLFRDYTQLDLSYGTDEWYGQVVTLTFIPEPRGVLNIIRDGGKSQQVQNSDILETREPGTMWSAFTPSIVANAVAFSWQFGYPEFALSGTFTSEDFDYSGYGAASGMQFNGLWDAGTVTASPGTVASIVGDDPLLDGTTIDFGLQGASVTAKHIVITFTTTNNRLTPFLHTAQAFTPAGARTVGGTIFDSAIFAADPILDIQQVSEQDQKTLTKRRGANVKIRDVNGALKLSGTGYHALENCMADVYIDGALVLGNGLIKTATVDDLADTQGTARVGTVLNLDINDMWAVADDDAMLDDVILDGLPFNDALRLVLGGMGCTSGELAGITAGSGYPLPSPALGEKPCIRPSLRQKRSDFVRSHLMERHNDGHYLQCPLGVWTLRTVSSTVGTDPISGLAWNFSSSATHNAATTFPGRMACLRHIELPNDSGDFYNQFRVEGKRDPLGNPIVFEQIIWESISHPLDVRYLGRKKAYPEVKDNGLRTMQECVKVANSLISLYARSCRFGAFKTYLHPALTVGTVISVDGTGNKAEVTRVSGASTKDDSMSVTYMRLN